MTVTADPHGMRATVGELAMAKTGKPKNSLRFDKPASWWGSTWREALPRRVAASVRRISDREFELLACCYETPFQWHIQLEFGDDAVTLVRRANVCFRTADWPVLRGRRS